jgi:hypothetical protein
MSTTAGIDLSIVEAMDHPGLFGPWFRGGPSWDHWRAVLRAAYGLPLSAAEREFFHSVAEREVPARRVKELWIVAGRRAGKDSIASLITAYAATFFEHRDRLRPGERTLCACLACDRDQARIILNYVRSYFTDIPPLAAMIRRESRDGFELNNNVDISISTNSFRNIRGRAILCAVLDECAFYRDETSSNPDQELYNALKPGTATLSDDALVVGISTPYAQRGLLFKKFTAHYGRDDSDVLVIRAPSLLLNPTLDATIISAALEEDPAAAGAEWLAQWRTDIESYVSREAVDACVARGRFELPFTSGISYTAFLDPAGGSSGAGGGDSMTLAIACRDQDGRAVLCCLREARPPFSPASVVADFARTLKAYHIDRVVGDRWGGEFVREPFRSHGIEYQLADRPKSDFYRDLLPLINSGKVELLDNARMISQLCNLERRVSRAGKDSIDHPPGGAHDDLINSAAACLVLVQASASALWSRTSLPVVASAPSYVGLLFAVIVNNQYGISGITFWAASRMPGTGLCLVDVLRSPLAPELFHSVVNRLGELGTECSCPPSRRMLFTGSAELSAAFERLGYRSEVVESFLVKDTMLLLPVSAAAHIGGGRVRVHERVLSQSQSVPLGFLQGGAAVDPNDALSLSFLCGVAMLDTGRSLGRAA